MVPVLQFHINCVTQNQADQLIGFIQQRLSTRQHRVRAEVVSRHEMDSGFIEVSGSLAFIHRNHAEFVYDWLVTNGASYARNGGHASFHMCPEEAPPDGWIGCNTDPRAEYQEVHFAGQV